MVGWWYVCAALVFLGLSYFHQGSMALTEMMREIRAEGWETGYRKGRETAELRETSLADYAYRRGWCDGQGVKTPFSEAPSLRN